MDPLIVPTDGLYERQVALVGFLNVRLAAASVPVCRSFVAPGAQVPWDVCCGCSAGVEGQAWVAVERVYPVAPFPQQDSGAQRCHPSEYAADLVVGILRCAHTVDDQGEPPAAATVTADAGKVARDRKLMLDTLLCDFAGVDADPGTFRLGFWQPLGPSGGCVGGSWTATVALPACRCT